MLVIDRSISLVRSPVLSVPSIKVLSFKRSIETSGWLEGTASFADYSCWTTRANQDRAIVRFHRRIEVTWSSVGWRLSSVEEGLRIVATVLLTRVALPLEIEKRFT